MIDPDDPRGAHALERLERDLIGWLTSVNPDGQPQTMPVWFLWVDGEILVYSRRVAARNANLERNSRVSFHLDDDGRGDDIVSIEGEARFDRSYVAGKDNPPYLEKYRELLREYEWSPEKFTSDYPHPILIRATRVTIA